MRFSRLCVLASGVALLGACTMQAATTSADPVLNAEAEALYDDLVSGRDEALLARLASTVDVAAVKAQLPLDRSVTGAGPVPDPTVTNSLKTKSTEGSFYAVTQDYTYPDRIVSLSTDFAQQGEAWKVRSFKVEARIVPVAASAAPAA